MDEAEKSLWTRNEVWTLMTGLVLTSAGFWENFVNDRSVLFAWMDRVKMRMVKKTRYPFYIILSIWKALLFSATGTLHNQLDYI